MKLLIIGSLGGQLSEATKIAMEKGAKVLHAATIKDGLAVLRSKASLDLLMVDAALDVAELVELMKRERLHALIVACGTSSDSQAAVRAIRAGAKEYIPLPPDPEIIGAILAAVSEESLDIIYCDPAMEQVVRLAEQIAPSDASVLITGASGTGKEVLSRFLHKRSKRANQLFVSVNCAAIPENLLESELFGHEKGAFTGATARRIGKFEEANGGSLLLDEISEMEPRLQAKLLRAIQERVIDRVGGSKPVPVDIRIIATSNRDLQQEVQRGHFRGDLLYRLNVVNLKIPPLRERPLDIISLARHFAKKYALFNGLPERELSKEAQKQLTLNPWEGNVRELENTIHRAVLLATDDKIGAEAIRLPDGASMEMYHEDPAVKVARTAEAVTRSLVGRTVAEVERDLILDTLNHCLGNRTHAANILGISIRTLRNKLKAYSEGGVNVPQNVGVSYPVLRA